MPARIYALILDGKIKSYTGWHKETGNFECSSGSPEKLVDRWEWHPLVYNYLPFSNHGPVGRFTTCICCEVNSHGSISKCHTKSQSSLPVMHTFEWTLFLEIEFFC
jgi:hypothetical protein